ncbi:MAG: hypothetical protein HC819_22285 [Cyclobacteriaceae bacterium]|nr:hypothetical protein [Cyclobacteriaceae bacterium]
MKKGNHLLTVMIVLLLFGSAACTYYQHPGEGEEDPDPQPELSYVGSNTCAACHQETFNTFAKTGHPFILQQSKMARHLPIHLPTWISYRHILPPNGRM